MIKKSCNNRYYLKKARIHDKESPSTYFTLNDCLYRMNEQDARIRQLEAVQLENYDLLEKNAKLDNELSYLKEAIKTVQLQYKLKLNSYSDKQDTLSKLKCINEIHQQYELIHLREQGGTL